VTRPFEGVKILDFNAGAGRPLRKLPARAARRRRHQGGAGAKERTCAAPLSAANGPIVGLAPGWQAINGNKRSLTLDLQKPEAITIVKQLAASADLW